MFRILRLNNLIQRKGLMTLLHMGKLTVIAGVTVTWGEPTTRLGEVKY